MNNTIDVRSISLSIQDRPILNDISFTLGEAAIASIIGPSGCGKTTLLRCIAGFERSQQGEVWINGVQVSNPNHSLSVEQRRIGMVFQDYALFPHLNVAENIVFGLKQRKNQKAKQRLDELVELFSLQEYVKQYPHRLSGGQQQRVALARSMAPDPRILLLDEPFASLDIELREKIARELRHILKQDAITTIMVSHNQLEAFAMADVIGVMNNGKLLQWDSAFNLYHKPVNVKVADLIGEGVLILGRVINKTDVDTELGQIKSDIPHGLSQNSKVSVLIRPDDILHDDDSLILACVKDKAFRGAEFLYTLEMNSGLKLLSLVPSHHDHAINELIGIRIEIDHLVAFPERESNIENDKTLSFS